jgi:aminoglycoside phosphotransferase (APT) family kinase protein
MHGDFTPWNLRSSPGGQLTLVDWEEAGWGPPGADEVLYRAVSGALTRRPVTGLGGAVEAVDFWTERVADRLAAGGDEDRAFGQRLLEVLGGARRDRSDV